jgi:crossover junction endodeoxyribonuclease RuvC
MIILGLDPGTAIVGWGVIDTGPRHDLSQARCVGYGCVTTDKGMRDAQRLLAIANGVEALLKEHSPELVSIEKLFFARNVTTALPVSQARGVLLLTAERFGIPISEHTPMQVKQALTGYGKADKAQMQNMTKILLKLPGIPKPDDAADALAIAMTGAQEWRLSGLLAG